MEQHGRFPRLPTQRRGGRMRQLLYHWIFEPTAFDTTPSTNFATQNWPRAKEPFSLFTSSYGSAGKVPYQGLEAGNGLADNLYPSGIAPKRVISNWDRKQISQPPLVKPDQFVVINNFGSTPGVLPLPEAKQLNSYWNVQIGSFTGNPWRSRQAYSGFTSPAIVYDLRYEGIQNPDSEINMTNTALRLLDEGYDFMVVKDEANVSNSNPEGYVFYVGTIDGLADDIEKLILAWLGPIGVGNVTVNDQPPVLNSGFIECEAFFEVPRWGSQQGYALGTFPTGEPPASFQIVSAPGKAERRVGLTTVTSEERILPTQPVVPTKFFYENFKPNGFLQLTINDMAYFQEPIHTQALGISGDAAPFPQQVGFKVPQWSLRPNYYVLPGQTWDLKYTVMNNVHALNDFIIAKYGDTQASNAVIGSGWVFAEAFASYYLFEGANAMICHQLLKLGITVNPDTVDWYKRQILMMEGLDPNTFEVYLDLQRKWRDKQRRLDTHYQRGRPK